MVRKISDDGHVYHEPPYTKLEWLKMWDSAGPPLTVGSLSMPGKASPKSRATHCKSSAFSARVSLDSNDSTSFCITHLFVTDRN